MPAHKLHMCVLICQRQLAAVCMHACMQCSLKVVGVNRIVLKVAGVSRMFVGGIGWLEADTRTYIWQGMITP